MDSGGLFSVANHMRCRIKPLACILLYDARTFLIIKIMRSPEHAIALYISCSLFFLQIIFCTMAEIFERYAAQSASSIKPCAKHCLDLLESCIDGFSSQISPQGLPEAYVSLHDGEHFS